MEARFKTLQVVWGALMAGVLVYAVVVYCLVIFGGAVLSLAPRRALTFVGPVAVVGMIVGTMVQQRLVRAIPPGLDPAERMARYASAVILGLAVTEGCGLLVVTLGLLASAPTWGLIGGLIAIGVMALSGPNRREAGLGS